MLFFTPGDISASRRQERRMESRRLSGRGPRPLRHCATRRRIFSAATRQRATAGLRACRAGSRPTSPTTRAAGSALGRSTRSSPISKPATTRPAFATGPMAETINLSTSHMTDADLKAIAVYLKDQPGRDTDENQQSVGAGPGDHEGRRRRSMPTNAPAAMPPTAKATAGLSPRSTARRWCSRPIRLR